MKVELAEQEIQQLGRLVEAAALPIGGVAGVLLTGTLISKLQEAARAASAQEEKTAPPAA